MLFGNEAEGGRGNRADRTRDWIEEGPALCGIFAGEIGNGCVPGLLSSCTHVRYHGPAWCAVTFTSRRWQRRGADSHAKREVSLYGIRDGIYQDAEWRTAADG